MRSLMTPVNSLFRRAFAVCSIVTILLPTLVLAGSAEQKNRPMAEDQKILHVLNRLGFGARPGDVARVRQIGLDRYIDEQLHPERISDLAADARVKNLPAIAMSPAQLYAKYPQPGALLRFLQRRGDLPADLASLRENRVKGAGTEAAAV